MKRYKKTALLLIYILLCVTLYSIFAYYFTINIEKESVDVDLQVLTVWQIDSFEGGKGSRADYIRKIGEEYFKEQSVYIDVISLTSEAARINLNNGVGPDIISYGSGIYGLENYVNQDFKARVWCRGGYCILSIETDDFTLASSENTIINCGKDNFASVAALFCGLSGADTSLPTSAYVKLINGEYKFLLGTQRDIVRLQTRGVNFYVQPVLLFNDLYQYFSIVTVSAEKADICAGFIDYVIGKSEDISSLCLFCDGMNLYDNEMKGMEGLSFEFKMPALISEDYYNQINKILKEGDIDKLKSLLKSL